MEVGSGPVNGREERRNGGRSEKVEERKGGEIRDA